MARGDILLVECRIVRMGIPEEGTVRVMLSHLRVVSINILLSTRQRSCNSSFIVLEHRGRVLEGGLGGGGLLLVIFFKMRYSA